VTVGVGDRINCWLVLDVRDRRRVLAQCVCGVRRWIAADALAGLPSCGCVTDAKQRDEARAVSAERRRRRDRDWRPNAKPDCSYVYYCRFSSYLLDSRNIRAPPPSIGL
jgi:hypothetical protein